MKKSEIFIAKLYSACEIPDDYPNSPVLIDTVKMSDILEEKFLEVGLLTSEEEE